jgi:transposase
MCLFVRDLHWQESRRLSRILKEARSATYLRRAQVIAFSGQGMRTKEIASQLSLHQEYVRELIRRFNEGSFEALRPRKPSGRPSRYTPEEISVLVELASIPPRVLGLPFGVWSLRKLAEHAVQRGIVKEISPSTLQRMFKEYGVSFQRTKTWKQSNDPKFKSKKNASKGSTSGRRKGRG